MSVPWYYNIFELKKKENSFSFSLATKFFHRKNLRDFGQKFVQNTVHSKLFQIMKLLCKNWKKEDFCRKMLSHHSKFVCRTFSQNSGKFADIVVVGGGLVGSALACKLAKSQWLTSRKICLLESSPKKPAISQDVSNTPFSNRLVLYGPYKICNLAMKILLHNYIHYF